MNVDLRNCGVSQKQIHATASKLLPEINRIVAASRDSAYAFAHFDANELDIVRNAIKIRHAIRPSFVVLVGIGGSNLGTQAISDALGLFDAIEYADTVDADALSRIVSRMKATLRSGNQVHLVVISKSGTTTETIANFEVLLNVLKRHRKNAHDYVTVITDRNSALWKLGIKEHYAALEIPRQLGGRYSAFSAVSLYPLGLLGVDLAQFIEGMETMRKRCLSTNVRANPAALSAAAVFLNKQPVYDHFFFAKDFESLGKWSRQLIAESLGKEQNVRGKRVRAGVLPTVSIGSTDLHSVAQLSFGGPQIAFTSFVTTHFLNDLTTPLYPAFDALVQSLQKKSLQHIMDAISQGTMIAYKKHKKPFVHTRIHKHPHSLGQFLFFKMMETTFLAKLFGVNPFDQPAVELYKKETRALLRVR